MEEEETYPASKKLSLDEIAEETHEGLEEDLEQIQFDGEDPEEGFANPHADFHSSMMKEIKTIERMKWRQFERRYLEKRMMM